MPKSPSLHVLCWLRKMFCVLISRCSSLRSWAVAQGQAQLDEPVQQLSLGEVAIGASTAGSPLCYHRSQVAASTVMADDPQCTGLSIHPAVVVAHDEGMSERFEQSHFLQRRLTVGRCGL